MSSTSEAPDDELAREQRLTLLADAIGHHEVERGEITAAEIERRRRADRAAAVAVRGPR